MTTLTEKLYKESKAEIKEKFSLKNDLEIPRLTSVSLNVGIKTADADTRFLTYLVDTVSNIAGQKAVLTQSKKSIATFKLRENNPIGCKVTLRGKKMYEFLDRLVNISLPRIRDFRGLSAKGFNQSGHYSFGIKDHSIFIEVDLDNIVKNFGMNINIATSSKDKEQVKYLLKKIKFPIK